jgi:carboxymethylenebutenolidase
MLEKMISVQTGGGSMDAFVVHPEEDGPSPVVFFYHNAGGLSTHFCDMVRRVAAVGYYCVAPNLYYRLGNQIFDSDSKNEETLRAKKAASSGLLNDNVVADTAALLNHVAQDAAARQGVKACIGYCMGGRFAVIAAESFSGHFRATASLFGTKLVTDAPDSPHRRVGNICGEIYCGFAEIDPSIPLSVAEEMKIQLTAAQIKHRVDIHQGARHGYAFPWRAAYDRPAAERSWERIFAMLRRQVPVA